MLFFFTLLKRLIEFLMTFFSTTQSVNCDCTRMSFILIIVTERFVSFLDSCFSPSLLSSSCWWKFPKLVGTTEDTEIDAVTDFGIAFHRPLLQNP